MSDGQRTNIPEPLRSAVASIESRLGADVFAYAGPITPLGCERLVGQCEHKQRQNLFLMLGTHGGDAHAAFRMMRYFTRCGYDNISIFVPTMCKSAGTLICLGANEMVMSDFAELGPLDVQVKKPDEIFQFGSGLELQQALVALNQLAFDTFRGYLMDIHVNGGLPTAKAGEMAAALAVGLYSPIFQQIDPGRIGELERAIRIGMDYGDKLRTSNVKRNAIYQLVNGYPSHSFVIDREEAESLFRRVRRAEDDEFALYKALSPLFGAPHLGSDQETAINLSYQCAAQDEDGQQDGERRENATERNTARADREDLHSGPATETGAGPGPGKIGDDGKRGKNRRKSRKADGRRKASR